LTSTNAIPSATKMAAVSGVLIVNTVSATEDISIFTFELSIVDAHNLTSRYTSNLTTFRMISGNLSLGTSTFTRCNN
jgi:hypothetical protein